VADSSGRLKSGERLGAHIMERRKRLLTTLGAVILIAVVAIPAGQAAASGGVRCNPCSACDPCTPTHEFLQFQAFEGDFQATINGTNANAGQLVRVAVGVSITISIHAGASSDFLGWASNVGSFGNAFSETTSFTPTYSGGTDILEAVVNVSSELDKTVYGGYLNAPMTYGADGGLTLSVFSCISGDFWFPAVSDPPGQGAGQLDEFSVWLGIGGIFGTSNLWQAGVEIWERTSISDPSISFQDFSEGATLSNSDAFYDPSSNFTSLPTTVSVRICAPASGTDSWSIGNWYSGSGVTTWWNGTVPGPLPFYANLSSAEWVIEDSTNGAGGRYAMPAFNSLNFYDASWTDQNGTFDGYIGGTGSMLLESTGCGCGTEYGIPTSISPPNTNTSFAILDPNDPDP
jgi:Peptidase A4 family